MSFSPSLRRLLAGGLLLGLGLPLWAAPPARNLQVELRWVERAGRVPGGRGDVVVGTAGSTQPGPSVTLRSSPATVDGQAEGRQVLLLRNGGSARVQVGERVPLQWLDLAQTPAGNSALLRQGWTMAGQSVEVAVRWPGGNAPAAVELAYDASDGTRHERVATALQLPFGQWAAVARSGAPAAPAERSTGHVLSTQDIAPATMRELQLRITVAP